MKIRFVRYPVRGGTSAFALCPHHLGIWRFSEVIKKLEKLKLKKAPGKRQMFEDLLVQ